MCPVVYFSGYKGTSDDDIDTYVEEVVIHTRKAAMRNNMVAPGGRPSKQPKDWDVNSGIASATMENWRILQLEN